MCVNQKEDLVPQTQAPLVPHIVDYSIDGAHRNCHHKLGAASFHCTVIRISVDESSAVAAIEYVFETEVRRIVKVYNALRASGPFDLSVAVSSKNLMMHNFFDYNYGPEILYEDFAVKYGRELAPEFCINVLSRLPKQLKIGVQNNPKIECPMCTKMF